MLTSLTAPSPASAQSWRSESADLVEVLLFHPLPPIEPGSPEPDPSEPDAAPDTEPAPPIPLPPDFASQLGPYTQSYEAFTSTRVPADEVDELLAVAWSFRVNGVVRERKLVHLAGREIDFEGPLGDALPLGLAGLSLAPGQVLATFGFPERGEWFDALRSCGAVSIDALGNRNYLLTFEDSSQLLGCETVLARLALAREVLIGERIANGTFDDPEQRHFEAQLIASATRELLELELPVGLTLSSLIGEGAAIPLASIQGDPSLVASWAEVSRLLRALWPGTDGFVAAGERQAQILARNVDASGNPTMNTSYSDWLDDRGLLTFGVPITVAVFDTGVGNDSASWATDIHPAIGATRFPQTNRGTGIRTTAWPSSPWIPYYDQYLGDRLGHGSAVASVVSSQSPPGDQEPGGSFRYAQGIAPGARLGSFKVLTNKADPGFSCNSQFAFGVFGSPPPPHQDPPTIMQTGFRTAWDTWGARLSNHSYASDGSPGDYTSVSALFDQWVRTVGPGSGKHMTTIVATGNTFSHSCNPAATSSQVMAPSTAKNVISVGSTNNVNPLTQTPTGCPTDVGSSNPEQVSDFSCFGAWFAPAPAATGLHEVRIKPDLVAPGHRVVAARPYQREPIEIGECQGNCIPSPPPASSWGELYQILSGTSFAAPAVSGAGALARENFRENGITDPKPSLIKAALIATADSLGTSSGCTDGDCRPSHKYGWGRVNLARLTNDWRTAGGQLNANAVRRYVINETESLTVGQSWTSPLLEPDHTTGEDVLIVLVWTDSPGAALINDLRLFVRDVDGSHLDPYYLGNNLNENKLGVDDGYSFRCGHHCPNLWDEVNNVEVVFIPGPVAAAKRFQVSVTHNGGEMAPQNFSVFGYNLKVAPTKGN